MKVLTSTLSSLDRIKLPNSVLKCVLDHYPVVEAIFFSNFRLLRVWQLGPELTGFWSNPCFPTRSETFPLSQVATARSHHELEFKNLQPFVLLHLRGDGRTPWTPTKVNVKTTFKYGFAIHPKKIYLEEQIMCSFTNVDIITCTVL